MLIKVYDIQIFPDLDNLVFSGTVNISLNINKESKYIILHKKNLILSLEWISITKPNCDEQNYTRPERQLKFCNKHDQESYFKLCQFTFVTSCVLRHLAPIFHRCLTSE